MDKLTQLILNDKKNLWNSHLQSAENVYKELQTINNLIYKYKVGYERGKYDTTILSEIIKLEKKSLDLNVIYKHSKCSAVKYEKTYKNYLNQHEMEEIYLNSLKDKKKLNIFERFLLLFKKQEKILRDEFGRVMPTEEELLLAEKLNPKKRHKK